MLKPDRAKGNAPAAVTVEASAQQTPVAKEFDMNGSTALSVGDTAIRQLDDGLYSLNDLHQAAGGEVKHQPTRFMRLEQTKALIAEIEQSPEMVSATKVMNGGQNPGTFVCRELVYAYAMWISPKFNLTVIRAFDALHTVPPAPTLPAPKTITTAQAGELVTLIAERFPDGRNRAYAWSRFNAHFRIARYRELPASRFAEGCAYIRGMPAKDGSDPAMSLIALRVKNARFILTFNEEGRIMLREVGEDMAILRFADFAKAVSEPGGVPLKHLPNIINACTERLSALVCHVGN